MSLRTVSRNSTRERASLGLSIDESDGSFYADVAAEGINTVRLLTILIDIRLYKSTGGSNFLGEGRGGGQEDLNRGHGREICKTWNQAYEDTIHCIT